ncbi:MAG: tetratricopeptide repeat protein [Planctomycetes bacterium]|nr:tetratricopeptide repeat protein [Planctomycetota bacterium]
MQASYTSSSRPSAGGRNSQPTAGETGHAGLSLAAWAVVIIVAVTVVTFAGSLRNEFVNWDDYYVLEHNDEFRGFSGAHLRWMFTTGYVGHYQPLTWLSYAVDWRIWGLSPWGVHLGNILLHLATALGVFFVARRLISAARENADDVGDTLGALAAALLFAVHPLRVESVAWATERRDVLSGLWLMLTVTFYLRAVTMPRQTARRTVLVISLVCYGLSLLSKASGLTLPLILLLVDVYPLRRIARCAAGREAVVLQEVLVEKMPYVAIAVAAALAAVWAQGQSGALRTFSEHDLALRVGQACYGVFFYLWKSLWPTGLIPLYEQNPQAVAFDWPNVLSAGFAVGVTCLLWVIRRRWPMLLVAWTAYVVLLLPVLGFAQSGPQVVADRYSYFSCIPWAVVIGGGVASYWGMASIRRGPARVVVLASVVIIVMVLAMLSRIQTRIWADSVTLWRTVIAHAPDTGTAHANLASAYNSEGDFEAARRHSTRALEILPGNLTAHVALARSAAELGDLAIAERHYEIALEIRPGDPGRMILLAAVKTRMGKYDDAEALYRRMVDMEPQSAPACLHLGSFLASRRRDGEALPLLQRATRLDPYDSTAWFRLGVVLLALDEPAQAITALDDGRRSCPDDANLAAKLAWVLATCRRDDLRDGRRAVELARRAVTQEPENPLAYEALAAALAETGDFDEAANTLRELLADTSGAIPEEREERLREQLDFCLRRQPFRE